MDLHARLVHEIIEYEKETGTLDFIEALGALTVIQARLINDMHRHDAKAMLAEAVLDNGAVTE